MYNTYGPYHPHTRVQAKDRITQSVVESIEEQNIYVPMRGVVEVVQVLVYRVIHQILYVAGIHSEIKPPLVIRKSTRYL